MNLWRPSSLPRTPSRRPDSFLGGGGQIEILAEKEQRSWTGIFLSWGPCQPPVIAHRLVQGLEIGQTGSNLTLTFSQELVQWYTTPHWTCFTPLPGTCNIEGKEKGKTRLWQVGHDFRSAGSRAGSGSAVFRGCAHPITTAQCWGWGLGRNARKLQVSHYLRPPLKLRQSHLINTKVLPHKKVLPGNNEFQKPAAQIGKIQKVPA